MMNVGNSSWMLSQGVCVSRACSGRREKRECFLTKARPLLPTEEVYTVCGGCLDPEPSLGKALVLTHGVSSKSPQNIVLLAPIWRQAAPMMVSRSILCSVSISLLGLQTILPCHRDHLQVNVIYLFFFCTICHCPSTKWNSAFLDRCLHFACSLFSHLLSDALVKCKSVSVLAVASLQGVVRCLHWNIQVFGLVDRKMPSWKLFT